MANEFRKNLGISNNQSVRGERGIVTKMMKIFAMKSTIRQYKVDGLRYDVDLCFTVHKLVVEIYEDGHVYYEEEKRHMTQKLKETLVLILFELILT